MTSQALCVEGRFTFSRRIAEELIQFRTGLGIVKQLVPPLVVLPREEKTSKIGYFRSLVFGQSFANADEFLGFGAHTGCIPKKVGRFNGKRETNERSRMTEERKFFC